MKPVSMTEPQFEGWQAANGLKFPWRNLPASHCLALDVADIVIVVDRTFDQKFYEYSWWDKHRRRTRRSGRGYLSVIEACIEAERVALRRLGQL